MAFLRHAGLNGLNPMFHHKAVAPWAANVAVTEKCKSRCSPVPEIYVQRKSSRINVGALLFEC